MINSRKKRKIEPFTALFRGQPIVFSLSLTTGSCLSSFPIFLPLVSALDPVKENPNIETNNIQIHSKRYNL